MSKSTNKGTMLTWLVFLATILAILVTITYTLFHSHDILSEDTIESQYTNQKRFSLAIEQVLNRYFESLEIITKNAAKQPMFQNDSEAANAILYQKIDKASAIEMIAQYKIETVLINEKKSLPIDEAIPLLDEEVYLWQLFKGMPDKDVEGNIVAKDKRDYFNNLLEIVGDIRYIFEMSGSGKVLMLEPFDFQKRISRFDYSHRDYVKQMNAEKRTIISEGFISNDLNKITAISVASPILNDDGDVEKMIVAVISARVLHQQLFSLIKKSIIIHDNTDFHLVDKHGHVITSSLDKPTFFTNLGELGKNGTIRSIKLFEQLGWQREEHSEQGRLHHHMAANWEKSDIYDEEMKLIDLLDCQETLFEIDNTHDHIVESWDEASLQDFYHGIYEKNGVPTIGTFHPISIGDSPNKRWGLLIESDHNEVLSAYAKLRIHYYIMGSLIAVLMLIMVYVIFKHFKVMGKEVRKNEEKLRAITSKVKHDIRSPLTALESLLHYGADIPEDKRIMLRNAVTSIKSLIGNLVTNQKLRDEKKSNDSESTDELLYELIDEVLSEIDSLFKQKNIEVELIPEIEAYNVFSLVNKVNFKRVIANIVSNAIDAVSRNGKIDINLRSDNGNAVITITDNGCGIDEKHINQVFQEGITFNKEDGSGMGLSIVNEYVNRWGGECRIDSSKGKGTAVMITLPTIAKPEWFTSRLVIQKGTTVVIVDDEQSIHDIWKEKFRQHIENRQVTMRNIIHSSQFDTLERENHLYLVDYELLGANYNGIDLINRFNLNKNAILVTSHFENIAIRKQCEQYGIKLLPKRFTSHVTINIVTRDTKLFLDDSLSLTQGWKLAAKEKNVDLVTFTKSNELYDFVQYCPKDITIYVDYHLGDHEKGYNVTKRLFEWGFKNLYLATAEHDPDKFSDIVWIKGVVGKKAPF